MAQVAPATFGPIRVSSLQRRLFTGAGILNLALWGYLAFKAAPTDDQVALHYTIYFEIDRVGEWYRLFSIPLAGAVVIVINALVPVIARGRDRVLRESLAGAAVFAQGILWLAVLTLVRNAA